MKREGTDDFPRSCRLHEAEPAGVITQVFSTDPTRPDEEAIAACASLLKAGALVAFPTETVYGLGALALRGDAVRRIFAAKGRPADNPLIVHVATADEAWALAREVPRDALLLAEAFWPGPLTMVLHKNEALPDETTAGLPTFGARVPAHPVALALLKATGAPLAAPSANRSGRPSPTRAEHVLDDLGGRIAAVLDAGETDIGLESTVIDMTADPPTILRPGGVTAEQIRGCIGRVADGDPHADVDAPKSPGLKYRHYAPRGKVTLLTGEPATVCEAVLAHEARRRTDRPDERRGYLLSQETAQALHQEGWEGLLFVLGSRSAPEEAAHRLYLGLRTMDAMNATGVYIESFDERGVGRALMDRIRRAAASDARDRAPGAGASGAGKGVEEEGAGG